MENRKESWLENLIRMVEEHPDTCLAIAIVFIIVLLIIGGIVNG